MYMLEEFVSRIGARSRLFAARAGFGLQPDAGVQAHLRATIAWLYAAQDATPDGGVAQAYFARKRRWTNSYPETTGYIIPTLLRYAEATDSAEAYERARRMTDWECDIQLVDGGVVAGAIGDSDQPTVFNTGQVLFGWVRAAEVFKTERYFDSAKKAADWLCQAQDADGCWRRFGSPMTAEAVNTYNTRTAWALARAHCLTGSQCYLDAAIANCDWALSRKTENGWLADNCLLDPSQPYLHTIAYAMRGFLEVGAYAGRQDFVDAAVQIADALVPRIPASGFMPGRFDAAWRPTVRWSCLTGNAQLALNLGRLFLLTRNAGYRQAVQTLNRFTRRTQQLGGELPHRGAVQGSLPIDGGYHPWQYPNWAAKFLVDALMMESDLATDTAPAQPFPG